MNVKTVKAIAVCVLSLAALPLVAADMPRSEWQALVGDCAQNPQTLKQTIAKLSAEDQVAFVNEVNGAISKMPGSDESRAAAFYAANRAAVSGASKDNLANVLAEVFATVPPEYLTEINERFATDLFSRTANPARVFSDEEFTKLATSTMAVINERCQKAENSGVRETFAALMFIRASGGTPADLAQTLVSQFPDAQVRETALNDWIKPALGDGQEQSYDPMLAAAQAGEEPDHAVVAQINSGIQGGDALLANLADATDVSSSALSMAAGAFNPPGVAGSSATYAPGIGLDRVPRAYIQSSVALGGTSEGPNSEVGGGSGSGGGGSSENPYYSKNRGSASGRGSRGESDRYGNQ